jgi:hypothetical protein
MALVKFEEGTLNIDAAVIGRGLNIEPFLVQGRMREGKITVSASGESTRMRVAIG